MQIKVESTTKQSKEARGQKYWGVKCQGEWYNVFVDEKPAQGAVFDVEVKNSEWNGKTYHWATPTKKAAATTNGNNSHSGEKVKISDYLEAMQTLHSAAKDLEPDDGAARAALVGAGLQAFSVGLLDMNDGPDAAPPPDNDDIPF